MLICFKTKHGATERYMNWLAEEIGAELKNFKEITRKEDFSGYEIVVVSSGTYAGLMPLKRFLKKYWGKLQSKRLVVVAVGAAPAEDPWSLRSYNRIPEKIREKIKYFKIMGDTPQGARKSDYVSPVVRANLKEVVDYIKTIK